MLFYEYSSLPVDHVDDNTDRVVMARGGSMMYAHIMFHKACDENEEIPLHNHVHEQITYVLKGSFKFEINDEDGKHVQVVKQGDSLYMPSDSRHGCIPLEDDSQLVDCFTPQRDDFLS